MGGAGIPARTAGSGTGIFGGGMINGCWYCAAPTPPAGGAKCEAKLVGGVGVKLAARAADAGGIVGAAGMDGIVVATGAGAVVPKIGT